MVEAVVEVEAVVVMGHRNTLPGHGSTASRVKQEVEEEDADCMVEEEVEEAGSSMTSLCNKASMLVSYNTHTHTHNVHNL